VESFKPFNWSFISTNKSVPYAITLPNEIHTLAELWIAAMQVQSQKAEIFQVGKRNIQNQKMIDNWGNAKIALPHHFLCIEVFNPPNGFHVK